LGYGPFVVLYYHHGLFFGQKKKDEDVRNAGTWNPAGFELIDTSLGVQDYFQVEVTKAIIINVLCHGRRNTPTHENFFSYISFQT